MKFVTEKQVIINENDFMIVRNIYSPVIGPIATTLYGILNDYSNIKNTVVSYFPIQEVLSALNIDIKQFKVARKQLEAMGLIRTFEKADNYHFIFKVNKPLSANQIRNNKFLYNQVMNKITKETFERIEYNTKTIEFSKEEFKETTVKFQDMFSLEIKNSYDENMSTLELPSKSFKSIEAAINGLNPSQFCIYLTNKHPQRSFVEMVNNLSSLSFSSRTLNLIIKYSFETNGKVVKNHVEKIARDLLNKDKTTFGLVNEELKQALYNKAKQFVSEKNKNKNKSQIDISDIYNQLGEL